MGNHEHPPGDDAGIPDPTAETAAPASLTGMSADLGDLPFPPNDVDRGIYDDGVPPPDDARLYGVPPSLLGVDPGPAEVTVPFADLDPDAAAAVSGLPRESFTADGGRDVTELHDPGDPEQYAGEPTTDGFDEDPVERGRADG